MSARGHHAEQVGLDPVADQRGRLDHVAAGGGEPGDPGEDRVAGGGGQLARLRAEHLAHEERVAGGERLDGGGLVARPVAQRDDRSRRQGREGDPARRPLAGRLAQGLAQGAVLGQAVVAVRRHDQRPDRAQPTGQVTDQVEGRLVGEVQVLHDEHRQASLLIVRAQVGEQGGEPGVAGDALGARHPDGSAPLVGDVLKWAEGGRRERPVACAPCDPRVVTRSEALDECLDQAGLADARLPGDQHQPAVTPAGIVGVRLQRGQLLVALEQVHQTTASSRSASAAAS